MCDGFMVVRAGSVFGRKWSRATTSSANRFVLSLRISLCSDMASPQSKELHLDHRSLLDDVSIARNLDVTVGIGEAGDLAGALERRMGEAVDNPYRIDLVAAHGRFDPAAER